MADAPDEPVAIDKVIAAIRAGDEVAVASFIRRYEPMLRRVLRVTGVIRWAQSQLDSQDLVQSVFIEVIDAIRGQEVQFRDEAGVEGYLRTAGRNRLRDHIRRLKAARRDRRRTIAGTPEALGQVPAAAARPDQVAAAKEELARVEACTPPADLEVMRERADGTDWQQLAAARGLTPEALRKRIERIRQRLRETLHNPDGPRR
jgi:RNA polymerase sigma factor (sigma-70 family)